MSDAVRRVAVLILLLPMLLLSLFSNGTMLTRNADDRITVVLCTGTEQVEMVWAEDGSLIPVDESPDHGHDDAPPCNWQISTQAAVIADVAVVPPTDAVFTQSDLSISVPLHVRRLNVLSSSARGPPRLI